MLRQSLERDQKERGLAHQQRMEEIERELQLANAETAELRGWLTLQELARTLSVELGRVNNAESEAETRLAHKTDQQAALDAIAAAELARDKAQQDLEVAMQRAHAETCVMNVKSTRQHYHQRIAHVLEAQFPETSQTQPELLAHHYTEAGLTEKEVHYWYHAGQKAIERSAHVEAIAHLRTGLELLKTLPETSERTQREVDLLITLGASLRAKQGTGRGSGLTYLRARHLLSDTWTIRTNCFPCCMACTSIITCVPSCRQRKVSGEQLLSLAQQVREPGMLLAAYRALGTTSLTWERSRGRHPTLRRVCALRPPSAPCCDVAPWVGLDVTCRSHAAWVLWFLGYPDQGLAQSQQAVTLAQQLAHAYSLGFALNRAVMFDQLRRDQSWTQGKVLKPSSALPRTRAFRSGRRVGPSSAGRTRAHQGQVKEGIE